MRMSVSHSNLLQQFEILVSILSEHVGTYHSKDSKLRLLWRQHAAFCTSLLLCKTLIVVTISCGDIFPVIWLNLNGKPSITNSKVWILLGLFSEDSKCGKISAFGDAKFSRLLRLRCSRTYCEGSACLKLGGIYYNTNAEALPVSLSGSYTVNYVDVLTCL